MSFIECDVRNAVKEVIESQSEKGDPPCKELFSACVE